MAQKKLGRNPVVKEAFYAKLVTFVSKGYARKLSTEEASAKIE